MKKILLMFGIAAMTATMVSCNGSNADNKKSGAESDSIADNFGGMVGTQIYGALESMTPEILEKQLGVKEFNKDEFLKGFNYGMKADTASCFVVGLQNAMQMRQQLDMLNRAGFKVSYKQVAAAFTKAFKGDTLSQEQMRTAQMFMQEKMMESQMRIQQMQQQKQQAEIEANKAKADEYIANLKKQDKSIQTTASGLTYKVVKQGEGQPVTSGKAKVIYEGRNIEGDVFDSSKGEPVEFDVDQVVPGFSEALKMMAPGSKYTIYVPDNLGYNGRGPVAPGSIMVFDVEVVGAADAE